MGQDSKYLGIGPKIMAMVFALVAVTSCAVGISTYQLFRRTLVQRELDDLAVLARLSSVRFAAATSKLREDVLLLSGLPAAQGIVRAAESGARVDPVDRLTVSALRQRLTEAFKATLRAKPQYSRIRYVGAADGGREIVSVYRESDSQQPASAMESALQQLGQSELLRGALQTPPGQVYFAEPGLELGDDEDHESANSRRPVIRAAAPIHGPGGQLFGVIVVDRELDQLCHDLISQLPPNHDLYIANQEGDYLLSPDLENGFESKQFPLPRIQHQYPDLSERLAGADRSVESLVTNAGGQPVAVGLCKLAYDLDRPERFLAFVLTAPHNEIVAASLEARNRSLAMGMLVLAPALVLGYFLSRTLVRPLQQIAASAAAFGRKDAAVALPLAASDEAGVVARALEGMMEQVRSREKLLENEVAERRRAEVIVRDQAARIRAIVNGVIDAIITITPQGIIESLNPAAERMFGYSAEELVGQNVNFLMPDPYRGEHDQYLRNYASTGIPKVIGTGREVVGVRRDGTQFPIDLAVTEVVLDGRKMFTGVVRDITDRKRSESALLAANRELERRAASIEAFNRQLARSNDELKQFAYVASHDLQEPLRKVTSFCEMLRDEYRDRLDGDAITYIDYAVSGALRMKALVSDLLEYSRVETQGKPLAPVSAKEALAEAVDNLEMAIQDAGAVVERGRMPTVAADRAQLVRLFQNLIGNAIKYRGDAPPRVNVWAESSNGEWVIHVEDNGIGIDPQYHARIFVIFQRLHSREAYSGTGIGLAVCKRIVERFGGRIWVNSTLGGGSDFCIALPKTESFGNLPFDEGQSDGDHVEQYAVQAD